MSIENKKPPWTDEQVANLNAYQDSGKFHPYTCGGLNCQHVNLVAERDGWRCPNCGRRQEWAHPGTLNGSWLEDGK